MRSPPWDFPRQAGSVRALCELGLDHGLDSRQCLRDTGLSLDDLDHAHDLISATQELQVIRNLLDALGHELPLGLEAGLRHHPTTFSIWGFAILSSETARQAVEVGLRYMRLTSAYCEAWIEEADGESLMVSDAGSLPPDVRTFLVERDLTTLLSIQRDAVPVTIPLTRLELQLPAPPYAGQYEALFGITPRFDQPLGRIGVNAALGEMRLPQGNPVTLRYCEQECQRLLDTYQQRSGTAGRVRDHLLGQTRQMPTMDIMAAVLGLSVRSLRRRLQDEETNYETLVEEVRRSLACDLLASNALGIEQIAERLGYSELASFSRAFKRWMGQSPRAWRMGKTRQ
ncbi:MAG: AraC family transcriptional regulator [Pseudomonadota bacterium]